MTNKELDEYVKKTDFLLSFQDIKDDLNAVGWTINPVVSRSETDLNDDIAIFKALAHDAEKKLDSTHAKIGKLSCELEQIPEKIKTLNTHAIEEADELRKLLIKQRLLEKCAEKLKEMENKNDNE